MFVYGSSPVEGMTRIDWSWDLIFVNGAVYPPQPIQLYILGHMAELKLYEAFYTEIYTVKQSAHKAT